MARRRRAARRASPTGRFLRVSRRQLAGLGIVGALGILGGLNAAVDLAEKLARLAHGAPPSGKPINRASG